MRQKKVRLQTTGTGHVLIPVPIDEVDLERNRAHIARHVHGHPSLGSKFNPGMSLDAVLGLALLAMHWVRVKGVPRRNLRVEVDGHVKVETDAIVPWGTCGVVDIRILPKGTPVLRELRGTGEDAYAVNVVRMAPPPETRLVLDFFRDGRGWYLHTFYPGFLTPPLQDARFWKRHAFIVPP